MLFECEDDARRVMEVLPKRFARYGLTLHPDKTRLVAFKRPDDDGRDDDDGGGNASGSFDFLGFTIHWGKSLSGRWAVKTRTAKDRFRRTIVGLSQWCKLHRHQPLERQQAMLSAKLRGHYGYYGRKGNRERLWALLQRTQREWRRWLNRRSQRARLSWAAMYRLLKRFPLATPVLTRPA
jgi:hypothetical protein